MSYDSNELWYLTSRLKLAFDMLLIVAKLYFMLYIQSKFGVLKGAEFPLRVMAGTISGRRNNDF